MRCARTRTSLCATHRFMEVSQWNWTAEIRTQKCMGQSHVCCTASPPSIMQRTACNHPLIMDLKENLQACPWVKLLKSCMKSEFIALKNYTLIPVISSNTSASKLGISLTACFSLSSKPSHIILQAVLKSTVFRYPPVFMCSG